MKKPMAESGAVDDRYQSVFGDVSGIIDAARRSAARSVNAVMTAAYWLIGRHIKDPFILEFLDLKDEYSESDLEEALISRRAIHGQE